MGVDERGLGEVLDSVAALDYVPPPRAGGQSCGGAGSRTLG